MLQSQSKARSAKAGAISKIDPKLAADPKALPVKPAPDYKVELSKPAPGSIPLPTPPLPSIPLPTLSTPDLPKTPESAPKSEVNKADLKKIPDIDLPVKEGSVKKPAIIFVKGLDLFSSPSTSERGYAGVGKIADSVEGAKIFNWDEHEEIIDEIKKARKDQKVILVGHSFGGDTALEVAEELDSLEHGFRNVDLLVMIDAVGADNDIIPQNVKNHLNVFGESSFLLNDGPHVARRNELTKVKNILSPYDHTELDDDKEIQFEVVNLIKETLTKAT
jgi:hypothetical protein